MIKNSMINAFNKARASSGYPTIKVVLPIDQWNLPPDIAPNILLDEWTGTSYGDLSKYWVTNILDVAIGFQGNESNEVSDAGVTSTSTFSFYAVYSNENFNLITSAFGFLITISDNDVFYRLVDTILYPTINTPAIIEMRLTKWDI